MQALERNAEYHRTFGKEKDDAVPRISELDRYATRLAGLLHDVGHGAFSHVTENLLRECAVSDFDAVRDVLRDHYEGVTKVAPSEILAVMVVLSEEMRDVFQHPHFEAVSQPTELAGAIVGRILGSRTALNAGYLSGIISGPIDADKLDYMARDSHHSGLPLGLDLQRLISKLEVVVIRPDNAPVTDLRLRAEAAPSRRIYEMGISLSGVGAYEQMIIGRVMLYDRLYHHHKIRTAESMVRRLIDVAKEEGLPLLRLRNYMSSVSDEAFLATLGGMDYTGDVIRPDRRATAISRALLNRQTYHRALCFAAKFIAGLDGLPAQDGQDTRTLLWNSIYRVCMDPIQAMDLEAEIYRVACELSLKVEAFAHEADDLLVENIVVDLPANRSVVTGNDLLVRTEAGDIVLPTLYFDPEKWSKAYEHQKLIGFVLTPRRYVKVVSAAAKVVLYERFMVAMGREADKASKTANLFPSEAIRQAANLGLRSPACVTALVEHNPVLARVYPEDLRVPPDWQSIEPGLTKRLSESLEQALPAGVPASLHGAIIDAIEQLCGFVDFAEKEGLWIKADKLIEKDLQAELRKYLRSRSVKVSEGSEVGGGETDLVLPGNIVVENKVRGTTSDPLTAGVDYEWQARRYAISMTSQVSFVVIGYRPANEPAILALPSRILGNHQTPITPSSGSSFHGGTAFLQRHAVRNDKP